MTRLQIIGFSILHAWGALLLPLLIVLLGGCLEEEKLEVPPPAACVDVEAAMNSAVTFTPGMLTVNDFVHTQATYAPLSNNPQVAADVIEQLIAVTLQPDGSFETRSLQTIITYSNGQQAQETKEDIGSAPGQLALCPSGEGVTYHGLLVYHRKAAVTDYKDSCGSFANCQIDITEVRFDQLVKLKDGRQDVRRYDFIFSKDVPYIARSLKACVTGTVEANGQYVPVTQCNLVKNFGNQAP